MIIRVFRMAQGLQPMSKASHNLQAKAQSFVQCRRYDQTHSVHANGENSRCNLTITPNNTLVDEEVCISASGLLPQQRISIVSRVKEKGVGFFANAYYITDETGKVDVSQTKAELGGTYDGLEPMGLFWSKKPEPRERPGMRLVKSDVTTPLVEELYVLDGFQPAEDSLRSVNEGHWLGSVTCQRWYLAEGVERIEVREGRLLGTLFIPKGEGPFPGVLDLFGTIGGITEHRAALFASHGIAAIALQYFKGGSNIFGGMEDDVEYFEKAVDYMLKHPKVMKPYAGVIGNSQGSMEALILTSLCSKIKACVAINGDHIVNLVDHKYKGETFPQYEYDTDMADMTEEGIEFYRMMESRVTSVPQKHIIPLERSNASFLLIHGEKDRCIPAIAGQYIINYLEKHNKTQNRLLVYPGTGHLIEPPHSPLFTVTYHHSFGALMLWGGEPRMHARAQEHSWPEILRFFCTTLSQANMSSLNSNL